MNFALVPDTDNAALTAFVTQHQSGLWRWLRAIGCDAAHAEEHCQDALLAALHHGMDALPEADARRWLRHAARNLFLMRLRAEGRRPQAVPLEQVETRWLALGGDHDGGSSALTALSRCLLKLVPRDRDLVARRYEHDQPRAEIARALQLTESGVKQALRRVRDKLRACVTGQLASAPTRDHHDQS